MKKRAELIGLSVLLLLCVYLVMKYDSRDVQLAVYGEGGSLCMTVMAGDMEQKLYPWYDEEEDLYYFFLPSFVNDSEIFFDQIWASGIEINGQAYRWGDSLAWKTGEIYQLQETGSDQCFRVSFLKSENLPAFFVSTDSGSLEYLHSDKENQEQGTLTAVTGDGTVEYHGGLDKISGRGNSTWGMDKMPYSITLPMTYSLGGLEAGQKWYLLALWYESDRIHSKLVYDMAQELGMDYAIQCTWVDLYCNGEYQGLYLLTEAVTVGDGRVEIQELEEGDSDISGGYLLEKEQMDDEDAQYIHTDCATFKICSPKQADEDQVNYIAGYMRWIESMILSGDEAYRDYVDLDSFADHLILENIALDDDGMVRSTFFYKDRGDDRLYLGPVWDYDRAMGEGYSGQYESEVFMVGMEAWYQALYADEEFYATVLSEYRKLRPYLQEIADEQIEAYADQIRASAAMDCTRWSAARDFTIQDYEESVGRLKAYLAERIEYLDGLWGEAP